jgi:hypothetical protein
VAKTKIGPPAPPNLVAARAAEKQAHAAQAAAPQDDEETSELDALDEIRQHLHDSIESAATALQLLDDLEAG